MTLQDAARIAREGLAEVFGIKLNRVGGLTKAARIRDIALAHGIDMFVMATGGSVLADTEALHSGGHHSGRIIVMRSGRARI